MKRIGLRWAVSVVLCTSLLSGCASWFEPGTSSLAFAEELLAHIDAGRKERVWDLTSPFVEATGDKQLFLKRIFGVREAHGELIGRILQTNWDRNYLDSLPEGEYREIIYWSKFEREDFAEELILVAREQGEWKLISYRVR